MTASSRRSQRVDVCIIGAGPAGSALANRLARLGYDVCLIERSRFPRSRIGESLSPGIHPQLEMLGVGPAVRAAGFRPCEGSRVQWESDVAVRRDFGANAGLLVDRARFDALLLETARARGVRVMQPAALRARARHGEGWRLEIESADGITILDAAFLADASGRSAALRGRKQPTGPRTLALYGYWIGASLAHEPRIEAGADGWYWGVPLPDGTYNAMVFVDATEFRATRATALDASYQALLARSGLMEVCRDMRLAGPVRIADATPYLDGDSIGPHHIKVGDAALTIDPLSSSGVQKAINTALTGAVVVNTLLRRPAQADVACRFYRDNLAESSDRHREWAACHYAAAARGGAFWQSRAAGAAAEPEPPARPIRGFPPANLPVALSPEATIGDEPCIVGDLVAMKPTLHHPALERPVAFLGEWEVAMLLRPLRAGITLDALMNAWQIRAESKPAIASWLFSHRVLTVHDARD
jgi:flavin-dependent dehydrogenase